VRWEIKPPFDGVLPVYQKLLEADNFFWGWVVYFLCNTV